MPHIVYTRVQLRPKVSRTGSPTHFVKTEAVGDSFATGVRISMITRALGTQNWSSFLCQRVVRGFWKIRWGRAWGYKSFSLQTKPCNNELIDAYLGNLPLVDVQSLRNKLVWSRKMKSANRVWAFGLQGHDIRSLKLEEVSDVPHAQRRRLAALLDIASRTMAPSPTVEFPIASETPPSSP